MKVELYGNTGFNSIDRPENLSLVRDIGNKILDSNLYNIIQSNNLVTITVDNISGDDANQVDYAIISDDDTETGYILTDRGYEFVADGTCKFYLMRDAWATLGGFKPTSGNEIIHATANRMHVSDDDTVYYTEIEPYKPSERCHVIEGINGVSLDPTMSEEVYNILETVVAPPKLVSTITGSKPPAHILPDKTEVVTGVSYTKDGQTSPIANGSNATFSEEGANIGEQVFSVQDNDTKQFVSISKSVLITPLFRKIVQTVYNISKLFNGEVSIRTGTMWWNADNMSANYTDVQGNVHRCEVLKDLRSAGAENGATAFWAVPKNYIESMSDSGYSPSSDGAGGISSIKSKTFNNTAIFTSTFEDYKNNKIYYGQALTIKVFSPVSGNELEKQAYEIRNPDCLPSDRVSHCDYSIAADIRSGGSPIFAWKYVNGEDQTDSYMETIEGGNWRQIPIAAVGNAGSAYEQFKLNQESQNKLGTAILAGIGTATAGAATGAKIGAVFGGGIGSIVGGVAGGLIGGVAGGLMSYQNQTKAIQEQQALLDAQGEKASVALNISSSLYLREIGRNSFYNLFSIYSENDIRSFDRFLTLYGYKVNNKIITADDFYSRPSFNFIRINEIAIESNNQNLRLIDEVTAELKNGLRIWHEQPNEQAIRSGNKEA